MKKLEGKLKKRFKNTFKFSNNNINKCILLLRKGADHEYMDDWEKFKETKLPKNQEFDGILNVEDIIGADYLHAKRLSNKKFKQIS